MKLYLSLVMGLAIVTTVSLVRADPLSDREYQQLVRRNDIEEAKNAIEQRKALGSDLTIWLSVTLGFITLLGGIVSQSRQAKDNFALKAAEIAFSDDSPSATKNRAGAIAKLFPKRLDRDFAADFDPKEFTGNNVARDNAARAKIKLFEAIVNAPSNREELIELWATLFPGDQWIEAIRKKT